MKYHLALYFLLVLAACSPMNMKFKYDNRLLEPMPPRVGEPMPELALLEETGKPFDWAKSQGKYTVLVGGCLT